MKRFLTVATFAAMAAGSGVAHAEVVIQKYADADVTVRGMVPSTCSWAATKTSGGTVHKSLTLDIGNKLVDAHGMVLPTPHEIPIGHAICTGPARISVKTKNGGLKRTSNGNCKDTSSKTCVYYHAEAKLGDETSAVLEANGIEGHSTKSDKVEEVIGKKVTLTITPKEPVGGDPIKVGTYEDLVTVTVGYPI